MARPMRTSETGLELIRSFEGFRARSAALPDGRWIIGYGHTETARKGLSVSRHDADLILRHHDVKRIENAVDSAVYAPLNQNEFDALVSFAFNIGLEAFRTSDVLAHINSGEKLQAAEAMMAWRRGNMDGQVRVIDALVRRRAAEIALFLEHPEGRRPLPSAMVTPERDPMAGLAASRETSIVVEARGEAGRTTRPQQRPANDREPAPQAAARAVAERLTRILGENASRASGTPTPPPVSSEPTVDEITRAVSALAEPEGAPEVQPVQEERRRPIPNGLPPVETLVVDDTETIYIPPEDLAARAAEAEREFLPGHGDWRWLPFALLSGLGLIGLFDGLRRFLTVSSADIAERSVSIIYVGPLLALGSGFLLFVSSYYLYRMLAHED